MDRVPIPDRPDQQEETLSFSEPPKLVLTVAD